MGTGRNVGIVDIRESTDNRELDCLWVVQEDPSVNRIFLESTQLPKYTVKSNLVYR